MPIRADTTFAIHPAIGIARLGDASLDPDNDATYYRGSEAPHDVPNEGHPYKTGGRLKKQAQRFRIYEFRDGQAAREITLGESDVSAIAWTVHLCNRKAAFDPALRSCQVSAPGVPLTTYAPARARNADVPPAKRGHLAIDAGARTVSGPGERCTLAGRIGFPDAATGEDGAVVLGTIWMEPGTGRLLVAGGNGVARGLRDGRFSPYAAIDDWVNNDRWYDDTADGRITARITFADGTTVTLAQPDQAAWVISTVPKYTPGMGYYTTLYDVAMNAIAASAERNAPPSFVRDIYPVLRSVSHLQWVSARGAQGHRPGRADYLANDLMRKLAQPGPDTGGRRQAIFARLRDPATVGTPAALDNRLMPTLAREVIDGGGLDRPDGADAQTHGDAVPYDIATVTPLQYAQFARWRDGDFVADFDPDAAHVALDEIPVANQPATLDRGALDGTAGTPFYPGIESWRIVRDAPVFMPDRFRLSAAVRPGDLTLGNALPWQADFYDCDDTWWPVQRPTEVLRDGHLVSWTPFATEKHDTPESAPYNAMVRHWSALGLVVSSDRGVRFVEDERTDEDLDG